MVSKPNQAGALLPPKTKHDVLRMKVTRWTATRKAFILDCILEQVITKQEAAAHFLPEAELDRYMEIYLANNRATASLGTLKLMKAEADRIKSNTRY